MAYGISIDGKLLSLRDDENKYYPVLFETERITKELQKSMQSVLQYADIKLVKVVVDEATCPLKGEINTPKYNNEYDGEGEQ